MNAITCQTCGTEVVRGRAHIRSVSFGQVGWCDRCWSLRPASRVAASHVAAPRVPAPRRPLVTVPQHRRGGPDPFAAGVPALHGDRGGAGS